MLATLATGFGNRLLILEIGSPTPRGMSWWIGAAGEPAKALPALEPTPLAASGDDVSKLARKLARRLKEGVTRKPNAISKSAALALFLFAASVG